MHHLRRALQPWRVPTYLTAGRLHNARVDLWNLEEALNRGDAEAVLDLYREPVAPGVDLRGVDDFRYALRRRVVDCLYHAGCHAAPEPGIRFLERVLDLDPLHEPAVQALLRHLLSLGHRQAALRIYQNFEARLQDEIGVDPIPETRALLQGLSDRSPRYGRRR
ncbi:MAG: bacterial transcriptional activator domain-containing protein [Armatimonadetes bacterium]|nr:bacterial transcriptional activator domain-containing protein [Armatimonadota bacterium]